VGYTPQEMYMDIKRIKLTERGRKRYCACGRLLITDLEKLNRICDECI
jgi:hypothetical protein